MKTENLYKAAVIYRELSYIDNDLKSMESYAHKICQKYTKIELSLIERDTNQEGLLMGEFLKIEIDETDVLKILNILMLKKNKEREFLIKKASQI